MDVSTGNDYIVSALPRQRCDEAEPRHRSDLAELADVAAFASAQVSRRENVQAEQAEEYVVIVAGQERARSRWRVVGVLCLVAAIGASVVTMIATRPHKPHVAASAAAPSPSSVATASALGQTARAKLMAEGLAVTKAACAAAYAADQAASPLLLPAPAQRSAIQDRYVASCMTP